MTVRVSLLGAVLSGSLLLIRTAGAQPLFDAPFYYPTGTSTVGYLTVSSLVSADFDRDGSVDLAVADGENTTVAVLLNDGSGAFSTAFADTAGEDITDLCAADFNGDGFADLAVGHGSGLSVRIFLNQGDSTFASPVQVPTQIESSVIFPMDFDQDRDVDLAVSKLGRVVILINDGDAGFTWSPIGVKGFQGDWGSDVYAADFNGDGRDDLAVTRHVSSLPLWGRVDILLNYGGTNFDIPVSYPVGGNPQHMASSDLDGDGDLDLAVVDFACPGAGAAVLEGRGDGTFEAAVNYTDSNCTVGGWDICAQDFNGDRRADLILPGAGMPAVALLTNMGDGTFGTPELYSMSSGFSTGAWVVPGDFDRDGHMDFAGSMWEEDSVAIFFNRTPDRGDVNGDGNLSTPDIILLVDYLFRKGAEPWPSEAVGDCNCSGAASVSDVVYLVNYVFRSGARPKCP